MRGLILSMAVGLLMTQGASAKSGSVILSEKNVTLNVDISSARLKLSEADYQSPVVKVLVPDLADVTVLDHRNTGEGAPCLATFEAQFPQEVIQNNPAVELIEFKVTLTKDFSVDRQSLACTITLRETINGVIRGFVFTHDRAKVIGQRHIDDCR